MSGAYLRSDRPMSVCSRVRRLGYTNFQWQNSLPVAYVVAKFIPQSNTNVNGKRINAYGSFIQV